MTMVNSFRQLVLRGRSCETDDVRGASRVTREAAPPANEARSCRAADSRSCIPVSSSALPLEPLQPYRDRFTTTACERFTASRRSKVCGLCSWSGRGYSEAGTR